MANRCAGSSPPSQAGLERISVFRYITFSMKRAPGTKAFAAMQSDTTVVPGILFGWDEGQRPRQWASNPRNGGSETLPN